MDLFCTVEFDGASRGNPGRAGAGAVLRDLDGDVIAYYREGLGIATNNQAEYRGLILGLDAALKKRYTHVKAYGDSLLVVNQMRNEWQVRDPILAELYTQATDYACRFKSFEIFHVPRERNSEADGQANQGINVEDGYFHETRGRQYLY